jgi:hypothetical protein
LLEVVDALAQAGLSFLIMGGHAVRHYGIDRNTFDFDFHIHADQATNLAERLRQSKLFSTGGLKEVESWRRGDFFRFQIGVLPSGKEEWLEFWLRNHLLPPFPELYARREETQESGRTLCFLSLPDLIRSKETERDDDWADVRLLEEVLDGRNLERAADRNGTIRALSHLRTRRGFERAGAAGLFRDAGAVREAIGGARHPVTTAYLLPFTPDVDGAPGILALDPAVLRLLRQIQPGSSRHLAVVEAVRLGYQRAAREADRSEKERFRDRR